MFHRHWVKTTGRVIDSRIRTVWHPRDDGQITGPAITLHNYIIEFRTPGGELVKREVEQQIETIDVDIGADVPLLVKPDGSAAVFDHKDPSINVIAVDKATEQDDEERFRQQLES